MTSIVVAFDVVGTPVAQGSKKAFVRGKRAIVVDTNAVPLDRYRSDIRNAALKEMAGRAPTQHSAQVVVAFLIARPASHFTTKGALTKSAPTFPRRPDADKALRACLDALTDVVLVDDSQAIDIRVLKHYSDKRGDVSMTSIAVAW